MNEKWCWMLPNWITAHSTNGTNWFWNGIVAGENAKFLVKSAVSQHDFLQGKVNSASDLGIEWQQNMWLFYLNTFMLVVLLKVMLFYLEHFIQNNNSLLLNNGGNFYGARKLTLFMWHCMIPWMKKKMNWNNKLQLVCGVQSF